MNNYPKFIELLGQKLLVKFNEVLKYPKENQEFKQKNFTTLRKEIRKKVDAYFEKTKGNMDAFTFDEIGNIVSESKLKELIRYGYYVSIPIHDSSLVILHKVAIFLGYEGWFDFVNKNESKDLATLELTNHFYTAILKMRDAYRMLPNIDTEALMPYFTGDGFTKLIRQLYKYNKNNWKSKDIDYYHFLNVEQILSLDEERASVLVKEKWQGYFPAEVNELNKQEVDSKAWRSTIYELTKEDDKWKISQRYSLSNTMILV